MIPHLLSQARDGRCKEARDDFGHLDKTVGAVRNGGRALAKSEGDGDNCAHAPQIPPLCLRPYEGSFGLLHHASVGSLSASNYVRGSPLAVPARSGAVSGLPVIKTSATY